MSVTREELAAFADGELDPARAAEVAAAVDADPALADEVRAHRALRARLGAHFAPILDAPLPDALTARLSARPAPVIDLAAARARRARGQGVPRWGWISGTALAASLVLMVTIGRAPQTPDGYAAADLAAVLDDQLAATQAPDAETRILLSFRDREGTWCRAFAGAAESGIACRDATGWRLRTTGGGVAAQGGDYRMAGNAVATVMEQAQALAAGPALDAAQERDARARGWR